MPNNNKDQPASVTRCLANGTVLYYQLFQYDSKGNITARAYFNSGKTLQSLTLKSYESTDYIWKHGISTYRVGRIRWQQCSLQRRVLKL